MHIRPTSPGNMQLVAVNTTLIKVLPQNNFKIKLRESVAVQRDGASRLAKNTHYSTPGMHCGAIFTKKNRKL